MLINQVTSLKISNLLRDLGVAQKSCFYWYLATHGYEIVMKVDGNWYKSLESNDEGEIKENIDLYSAFTVAELGEMLPSEIEKDGHFYSLAISKTKKHFWVDYCYYANTKELRINHLFSTEELTEANARGKMLIYLLENKLI